MQVTRPTHGHKAISDNFNSLASSVSEIQSTRQQYKRKRKRQEIDEGYMDDVLQIKQLYVDGFTSEQIWEQAFRILESTAYEIKRDFALNAPSLSAQKPVYDADVETAEPRIDDSTTHAGSNTNESVDADEVDLGTIVDSDCSSNRGLEFEGAHDSSDDRVSGCSEENDVTGDNNQVTYTKDPFKLNDGFFSIDEFNRQTELFEKQDTKGGPGVDADTDDDSIDWHSNPFATRNSSILGLNSSDPNTGHNGGIPEDSDEEGPTFDHMDISNELNSDDDIHASVPDEKGWINTNDIKYSDFFAPPPRKALTKSSRSHLEMQPHGSISYSSVDRAMSDVRRDLFEDEITADDMSVAENDSPTLVGQRSSHEKQRARIINEIRLLEAANVAKKDWMLGGEARAVERPTNSLIEEDMEFERIGKPVPVVTAEVSENIEVLIKHRILVSEFDEVIRRRPGILDSRGTKRERFELNDAKAQQGLAELYETDHLRATDPNYVDPSNQKLVREHSEVSNLWSDISSQLDTLSNWHYKPKAPQPSINVVTDVATITMEDARPTASSTIGSAATLAPQEIYTPGSNGKVPGEVVLKSGMSVAKEEMSREAKARLRRLHKKQKKGNVGRQQHEKAAEREQVVSDLRKGGVKVIGKEGEVTDIQGNKISRTNPTIVADALKL
ncbi:hypothetical protein EYZ11_007128 [Aspergillus tanneri]|uniref:U3 small nucleolar ribonucleoprotein protein MPP10 n=1 Tax=Aspergillus tanneri TaxID=1220188 RepID=A0A4S3JE43_9EURO|nr:hypothetical protein EYZ11_007128 [Aspergillus tanneri]